MEQANMSMIGNPFCLEPIKVQQQFFGRQREIRRVLNSLNSGQCVSVVGEAQIGKTSLLNYVAERYVRLKYGLAKDHMFAYLDGTSLATLDLAQCFVYIRKETIRQIKEAKLVDKAIGVALEEAIREASSNTIYFGLQTLFRSAQTVGLKLVIVLDHLDTLKQNFSLEERFAEALRSFHTGSEIAYLVASQSPLDELERTYPESSPFFNIFHEVRIGPFTSEESRDLVVTSLEAGGAEFAEPLIDYVITLGHNKPYRLQRAGHAAFEVWQENGGHLSEEHCGEIRRRFDEMEA
jgi:AAA+ ATPase superfamily predicted ATPase